MRLIKNLHRKFNKDKYIKVINFTWDKKIQVSYYLDSNYKPKDKLINNDHFFMSGGYRTLLLSDTKNESINPLDLESAYPVEKFKTAIESKVINDVFNDLKPNKLEITTLLLIGNLLISGIVLYYIIMGGA